MWDHWYHSVHWQTLHAYQGWLGVAKFCELLRGWTVHYQLVSLFLQKWTGLIRTCSYLRLFWLICSAVDTVHLVKYAEKNSSPNWNYSMSIRNQYFTSCHSRKLEKQSVSVQGVSKCVLWPFSKNSVFRMCKTVIYGPLFRCSECWWKSQHQGTVEDGFVCVGLLLVML